MIFAHLLGLAIAQERAKRNDKRESRCRIYSSSNTCVPRRIIATVLYCGCFFSFGTTMSMLGPTLIELGHLVHHGLDMMSWLFFTQAAYALLGASIAGIVLDSTFFMFGMSVGMAGPTLTDYLISFFNGIDIIDALSWLLFTQSTFRFVGAIVAGLLIDRFNCNRNLLLLCFLLLNAIFLAIIPLCRTLWLLILSTAAAGFSVGILDTATNVQLISIHGKKVSPYLQALYFSYGFGAFVSPLIAEPFLSGTPHPDIGLPARRESPLPYGGMGHRGHHHLSHHHKTVHHLEDSFYSGPEKYKSEVQIAYWIIAIAHLPVVIGLAYIVISEKWMEHRLQKTCDSTAERDERTSEATETNVEGLSVTRAEEHLKGPSICDNPNKTQILCVTFWTSFLVFLYDGMQGSYGGYVYTYAVKSSLRMTSAQGAFLTSVFWGSLALGRLISIPIALFLSPAVMLLVDLVGCLVSSLLMLAFRASEAALWMGTSTFGLFMSNVFPTSVALAEQYFNVTGTVTCMFVVSAAIGEMIIPLIVGKVFDYVGAVSFLAEGCILCFASFGAYLAVLIMGKGFSSHGAPNKTVLGEGKEENTEDNTKNTFDKTASIDLKKGSSPER